MHSVLPNPMYSASAMSMSTLTPLPGDHGDTEKSPLYIPVAEPVEPPAFREVEVPDSDYPDGGLRAWLVVFGVACGLCATFGFVNAWGVFQAYYEQNTLRDMSPSDIAWIGSIQYALVFMPGLVTGRLFDMGYLRLPIAFASALLILCAFLTGECKVFWQYLLCQGFGIGIGSGIVFTVAVGTIPHWFKKKLGLALAAMAAGSSVGGTIFPIILRNLLEHTSFQWTLRITGFIVAGLLLILNLTIKRRLPPKPQSGPFINFALFKSSPFTIYTLSLFMGFLGIYTCLTYLSISGILAGINQGLAFYLLSITNACSLFGRLGGGILADRYGNLNTLAPLTFIAGIMTYAWPFAQTQGSLIAIAVLYGLSSGAFVAIFGAPLVNMGAIAEVGMRTGMAFSIMSLGALAGPPISGAIFDHTGSFENVGYYAGTTVMVSVALMLVVRHLLLDGRFIGHA
ncbi:MFS general substrate transporter [Lenzites betulinus]|nr:MFS general substrate transporter [Lenzites betulinus]